jgi:branched-chain amino acid transport system substrate-binding protein
MKMLKGLLASIAIAACLPGQAFAQKQYGPGVSDTEIKLGQTMPFSGPVSAFAAIGKAELAYFAMVNAQGGINGRKINLISLDDGFSPPKSLQQTRRLVESENVLAILSPVGTATNATIQEYLADQKVPHLFVASGASRWGDYEAFPWTMGWQPSNKTQMKAFVDYALSQKPDAKIAVLFANDESGRDMYGKIKAALGAKADRHIVAAKSYETTDPSVDNQVIALKASGADVFFNVGTPKFTAQAIRKAYDIDWHPLQMIEAGSAAISAVLQPAGLEKSDGLVSSAYSKDPNDPQWADNAGVKAYKEWLATYHKDADPGDLQNVYGYSVAQTFAHVLKNCGDNLTRENLVKQAANIQNLKLDMLLEGITVNTGPNDYYPIKGVRLQRFDGTKWIPFGSIVGEQK